MALIKCPRCGKDVSQKADFCPNCQLAINAKKYVCKECGAKSVIKFSVCPNCGYKRKSFIEDHKRISWLITIAGSCLIAYMIWISLSFFGLDKYLQPVYDFIGVVISFVSFLFLGFWWLIIIILILILIFIAIKKK